MRRNARRLGATLAIALALGVAHSRDEPGLTAANFVDVGDSVTAMLDTSGLVFSTLVIGSAATRDARLRPALFRPPMPRAYPKAFESPCPGGGSVKAGMRDTDGSGELSTGDRFVTVFESCVIEGSVVTGRSEFVVVAHRFEGVVEFTELDFVFKDLGTAELRWAGPAHVALRTDLRRGTERYVVTYRGLAVTHDQRGMRWNFSLDKVRPPIGNQVASVNGEMTVGDLRLRLRQDEPYAIPGDGFPRSGQLTASDSRGAHLQVEAGRWRYAYRLFLAGNQSELPDSTSQSKPYGKH